MGNGFVKFELLWRLLMCCDSGIGSFVARECFRQFWMDVCRVGRCCVYSYDGVCCVGVVYQVGSAVWTLSSA